MITVTAGLIRCNGKILIAKRSSDGLLPGKWEFPGGKIEPGESPEDCLTRELMEELGISVNIHSFFAETLHDYETGTVRLLGYEVVWIDGEIVTSVHDCVHWVEVKHLASFSFLPADIPFVDALLNDVGCR